MRRDEEKQVRAEILAALISITPSGQKLIEQEKAKSAAESGQLVNQLTEPQSTVTKKKTPTAEKEEPYLFTDDIVALSSAIRDIFYRHRILAGSKQERDYLTRKIKQVIKDKNSPEEVRRIVRGFVEITLNRKKEKKNFKVWRYPRTKEEAEALASYYDKRAAAIANGGLDKVEALGNIDPSIMYLEDTIRKAHEIIEKRKKKQQELQGESSAQQEQQETETVEVQQQS